MIAAVPENVRYIRPKVAYRIMACGRTWFNKNYVKTGKITPIQRGTHKVFFYPQVRAVVLEEARAAGAIK